MGGPEQWAGAVALSVGLSACIGCGSGEPPEPDAAPQENPPPTLTWRREALARSEHWTPVEASDDPFEDRPASFDCDPLGRAAEALGGHFVYAVETGRCAYLTAVQPTLVAVEPGDQVEVRVWHFDLSAPGPARAHVALYLGDQPVLDEEVAIPASPGQLMQRLQIDVAWQVGTPMYFHVHNHGENTWALVSVDVLRPGQ